MLHAEIIQNEWAAGIQRVVARVVLADGGLTLETDDLETWEPIALRPFRELETGAEVSPVEDPEGFVRHLHEHLSGDYLFATEAHEPGQCEYDVGAAIPLNPPAVELSAASGLLATRNTD
jgi:hypothetical protein